MAAAVGVWLMMDATPDPPAAAPTPVAGFDRPGVVPVGPVLSRRERAELGPNRVVIPSLDVNAPVETMGTTDGLMDLPGPDRVGTVGDVYAGHVSYNGVRGALYPLYRVRAGARVYVSDAEGDVSEWVVETLVSAPKQPVVLDDDEPDTIRLVTCGGQVELVTLPNGRRVHTYADNVIASARQVRR